MSHNKPDVYIAVKKDNAEKVEALFLQHQIDFDEDDMCSPFGSDGSLYHLERKTLGFSPRI